MCVSIYVSVCIHNISYYFISICQLNESPTQVFSVFLACFVFVEKTKSIIAFKHMQEELLNVKYVWNLYFQN